MEAHDIAMISSFVANIVMMAVVGYQMHVISVLKTMVLRRGR